MTDADKIILEEIIKAMSNDGMSDNDCILWRAHCIENDEWTEIKNAWLRVKDK